MSSFHTVYLKFKRALPDWARQILSAINQRLFARRTIQRQYGSWFEVDWRKKFRSLSDEEWQRAYDEVWKHHQNDCVEETDTAMILAALGEPGSVLEVGCGMGSLSIKLAQAGFQVTGLDVSPVALEYARQRAAETGVQITWQEGFAENLPVPDKTFDYITCCHTLEHVRDLDRVAAEFKRVARKKIVVLVPKQQYRLYADNYHTQFFERREQLANVFGLTRYQCTEIDCRDHQNEFQGRAFLYVGNLP
ncbi:MAG: methyltransferase domain-containing protein [candidate division KSB1 bacterium]|nr:methyltransferase domain-containing protein [candidate division KSB1 bacterium]MDZ7303260.1 methyltransferase domain-containing protein [candidate division KSB1 bacterium]MDZ7312564.1 methyltransferase domain-containing protein [candidate division KSB1 bacterium]